METVEDIVIVGAGIAGLTTALGLHRMGFRSLVLESWDGLRTTGFAFTTWMNAWKAFDALGIGDSLRRQHAQIEGIVTFSAVTGLPTSNISFKVKGKHGDHEVRCVKRKVLLDTLAEDLPQGTVRFSSKVVLIEDQGYFKLVHLADGTILKTKVLIGCDGVNSVVARWLGLQNAIFTGRLAIRAMYEFPDGHSFGTKLHQLFGDGFRAGFLPCDEKNVYWFLTFTPSDQEKPMCREEEEEEDPTKMKDFVLRKLGKKVGKEFVQVVEKTHLKSIIVSPLRLRWPTNVLWGSIWKGNVCVAGDALHPMTPDIGQGGCSALEDGIVLARCLAQALSRTGRKPNTDKEERINIEIGLKRFGQERKWRSFQLITTAYILGITQQSNRMLIKFLRDKILSRYMARMLLRTADYDCGNLNNT